MPAKPGTGSPDQTLGQPVAGQVACSLLRRLLVMLYDALVILALMMLATGLVLLVHPVTLTAGRDFCYTLYLLTVWFLYLAWCWQHGGLTLGMRAWRVQLITDSAKSMGWVQSALRFGASFVSALPLGAGYLWSLFDPDSRTWHDRWSRSRLRRTGY
jgi:uncharacterized RDD family membrane protein YckC